MSNPCQRCYFDYKDFCSAEKRKECSEKPDSNILRAFDTLEKALLEAGTNQAYRHAAVALSAIKSLLMSAEGGEAIT